MCNSFIPTKLSKCAYVRVHVYMHIPAWTVGGYKIKQYLPGSGED